MTPSSSSPMTNTITVNWAVGLVWYSADGTENKLLISRNLRGIVKTCIRTFVLCGLEHLMISVSAVYEIKSVARPRTVQLAETVDAACYGVRQQYSSRRDRQRNF